MLNELLDSLAVDFQQVRHSRLAESLRAAKRDLLESQPTSHQRHHFGLMRSLRADTKQQIRQGKGDQTGHEPILGEAVNENGKRMKERNSNLKVKSKVLIAEHDGTRADPKRKIEDLGGYLTIDSTLVYRLVGTGAKKSNGRVR